MSIKPADISQYKGQALVTINYDDGQKNNFDVALPVHVEFNMQAGFAIIAERTIRPASWTRYMEPWQVIEASRLGVEICSHSYTHPRLTEVDDEHLARELKDSKELLEGLVRKHQPAGVTSFCIPYSASSDKVIAAAQEQYSTIRGKGNKFTPLFPTAKQPIVCSYGLDKNSTLDEVKTIIDKAVIEKAWVTLMLHGVVEDKAYALRDNDIDVPLLSGILGHIRDYGREMMMPINLSDIHAVRNRAKELQISR